MKVEVDLPDDVVEWLADNNNGRRWSVLIVAVMRAHIETEKMIRGYTESEWQSIEEPNAASTLEVEK